MFEKLRRVVATYNAAHIGFMTFHDIGAYNIRLFINGEEITTDDISVVIGRVKQINHENCLDWD